MPGVSVIIPAYNYGRFLSDAIDSALAQTYSNFEVIVINDGSTDNTPDVAARYGSKIRYLRQDNAGLPAARNSGIKAARHPFVAFLDADDVWEPEMLASAMRCFSELDESVGLIACASVRTDAEGRVIASKRFASFDNCEIKARDLLLKNRFMPSAVVAKRAAFHTCGLFDTSLRSSEDRDMWIRIATKYRVNFHGKTLVRIRKHGSNMSRHADRMKRNMRRVICKAFHSRVVPRANVFFWLRVLAFNFFEVGWMHYDEGAHGKAVFDMLRSMLLWPMFLNPTQRLNEPRFFRARALIRFLLKASTAGWNSARE